MSNQIQTVKNKLNTAINQLCETSWMFVKDPSRDFTRNRKLPLHEMISVLLCMEGGSLTGELLLWMQSEYFVQLSIYTTAPENQRICFPFAF